MSTLTISADGRATFVYDDALRPILELGTSSIRRVSNVEPTPDGLWTADMAPIGGPVLGPYSLRAEALAAELAWLEDRLLDGPL